MFFNRKAAKTTPDATMSAMVNYRDHHLNEMERLANVITAAKMQYDEHRAMYERLNTMLAVSLPVPVISDAAMATALENLALDIALEDESASERFAIGDDEWNKGHDDESEHVGVVRLGAV